MARVVNSDRDILTARISTRGHLWGREKQETKLKQVASLIQKESSDCKQVALVHGPSGSGKTSLCNALRPLFPTYRFMAGKFNQYQDNSSPYSALVQALEGLLVDDNNNDDETREKISPESLLESLGPEAYRVMCELIPAFAVSTPTTESEEELDGNHESSKIIMASELLAIAVETFLNAISSSKHPTVLVVDDLQWADDDSLTVLNVIVHSREVSNLLLLGIYRDDDDDDEPNSEGFRSLLQSAQRLQDVHDISVENLDLDHVSALVGDLLCMDPVNTSQESILLVDLIYRKTSGNPYFIVQFLVMVQRSGLLKFNYATEKWQWDLPAIQSATTVADNVAVMLTDAVKNLPLSQLRTLQLAAYLGFVFDVGLLEPLLELSQSCAGDTCRVFLPLKDGRGETKAQDDGELLPFPEMMGRLVQENFLQADGNNLYRFTHDKLQQTVYELVLEGKARDELHWFIGKYIEEMITNQPKSRSKFLFLAADQLNRGSSCIDSEEERLSLIRLNLEAGQLAKQRNGLDFIGLFLCKAMHLIRKRDWEGSYELVLELYNSMAFFEATRSRHEGGIAMVEIILQRARRPEDTIIALVARSKIRAAQLEFNLAIKDCKTALRLCGERLPAANVFVVVRDLLMAKRMVNGKSDEELLQDIPTEMVDMTKMIAMKTFLTAAVCGWYVNNYLMALCALGQFRTTYKYGQSPYTGTAMACFGALLAGYGNYELGYRFGQLGLGIKPGDTRPDATMAAYASVVHLKLPIASLVEPCLAGYRKGLEMGETFFGSICLGLYADAYKGCGLRLDTFAADIGKFAGQLKTVRRDFILCLLLPNMQLAMNLSGQSEDPMKITWDILVKHGYFNDGVSPSQAPRAVLQLDSLQMFNSYILRDIATAETVLNRLRRLSTKRRRYDLNHFNNYFFALTEGLVGFWLGSRKQNARYRRFAIRAIQWLKKRPNLNTVPLRLLLEAQKASTERSLDVTRVRSLYDSVIVAFARSGLVHYNAIANEQIGEFLLGYNEPVAAAQYLKRSAQLYREWGATVKVEQLMKLYSLHIDGGSGSLGTTLRGRERFSARLDTAGSGSESARRGLIEEQ